jgi:hypothetical protein
MHARVNPTPKLRTPNSVATPDIRPLTRRARAHKQIREKEVENNKLGEYVQDLAVSVAQREKIMRVRRSEEETADDREYKMQVSVLMKV